MLRWWGVLKDHLVLKVKNDHRSIFSNLSNWKEAACKKNQGLNGIPTRDLRDNGAMLYQMSYEATIGSEVNVDNVNWLP